MRPRAGAGAVRVAVVGAGVLGMAAADALHRLGAEVVLVEAEGPAAGTSSRGAGLVCEGMWHPTSLALVRRSMALLSERGLFHRTGSATLVPEPLVGQVRALAARQRAWGADARVTSPEAARELPRMEGVRLDDAAEVVHYPRDGWASPRRYVEAVHEGLLAAGVAHARGAARLRAGGGLVVDAEAVAADAVVIAAGVRTRELLRSGGLDAPLQAYRTQAARYHHPRAHEAPMLHDAVQGFYLRPDEAGRLLAGNGTTTTPEDPASWRREADEPFLRATMRRLRHRLPRLEGGEPDAGWAGLDAATPDRLLLAGAHPDAPRVWLLAGGNGHGFMRAPAAGESLAHLVLGRAPPVAMAAYDPARFAGRMSAPFAIREGYSLSPEG